MSLIPQLVPDAVCVAVSSGKGGVGKTTTAAAVAVALAQRGHDVVAIDADVSGPNLHLALACDDMSLSAVREPLELVLPSSSGVRLASPVSFDSAARLHPSELVSAVRFSRWPTHVVVDLPPGWTDAHQLVASLLPDVVLCCVAPTPAALSDHGPHVESWRDAFTKTADKVRSSDKRRRWSELPDAPVFIDVETMARFRGVDERTGDLVTVRRADAVDVDVLAESVSPLVSLPATVSSLELAGTEEMAAVVDAVEAVPVRPAVG